MEGPKKAPIWPTELMRPNAAAAVASERNVVGIAHRLAKAAVAKK